MVRVSRVIGDFETSRNMIAVPSVIGAFLLISGASLQAAAPQRADSPVEVATQSDSEPTPVDDVVVSGRSLRETVEAFVSGITSPPPGHGPARWHRRVCVGVVNLRPDAAQQVIDQVSRAATLVDLEPLGPGCSPNILVIATADADGLANALVEGKPNAFRPDYAGAAQSAQALNSFRASDQPVRWWHVSMPVVRDTGTPAVRLPRQGPPMIPGAGRLRTEVTNRLLRSFVILDVTKMEGTTFQQVGDYVAMVALAQIDPDADTSSFNTVMNVFNNQTASLTDWDQAYLRSLYGAYLNERNTNAQVTSVGNVMVRDRRASERLAQSEGPADTP